MSASTSKKEVPSHWGAIKLPHISTLIRKQRLLREREATPAIETNGDVDVENYEPEPPLPPKGELRTPPPRIRRSQCSLTKTVSESWSSGTRCCFGLLYFLTQVFLCGSLALVIYWVFTYRGGIAWQEDINKEFNLHPILMVGGFVFLLGQAILVYRGFRCCRKIYNKLCHTILHLLVMPAAAIAVVAVFDFHGLKKPPIPDLYSLHSWMGLATLGLFGLQFIVGFISFLVLLCCEESTAEFRAALLPLHVHFGLATFLLVVATCVTSLTEKAIFTLGDQYQRKKEEGIVINILGLVLIVSAILVTYIVRCNRYRRMTIVVVNERL